MKTNIKNKLKAVVTGLALVALATWVYRPNDEKPTPPQAPVYDRPIQVRNTSGSEKYDFRREKDGSQTLFIHGVGSISSEGFRHYHNPNAYVDTNGDSIVDRITMYDFGASSIGIPDWDDILIHRSEKPRIIFTRGKNANPITLSREDTFGKGDKKTDNAFLKGDRLTAEFNRRTRK